MCVIKRGQLIATSVPWLPASYDRLELLIFALVDCANLARIFMPSNMITCGATCSSDSTDFFYCLASDDIPCTTASSTWLWRWRHNGSPSATSFATCSITVTLYVYRFFFHLLAYSVYFNLITKVRRTPIGCRRAHFRRIQSSRYAQSSQLDT